MPGGHFLQATFSHQSLSLFACEPLRRQYNTALAATSLTLTTPLTLTVRRYLVSRCSVVRDRTRARSADRFFLPVGYTTAGWRHLLWSAHTDGRRRAIRISIPLATSRQPRHLNERILIRDCVCARAHCSLAPSTAP